MKRKLLFSAMCVLTVLGIGAQTPFFTEDFEGATHKFTIVNGTQTNQWHIGTAAYEDGIGKAAYISNDGGTTYAYTITTTSVAHMYADIDFSNTEASSHYVINLD